MYDLGDLNGPDGNAYFIMAKVTKWMKECGFPQRVIERYWDDAKSSDYDNLVRESQRMVDKLNQIKNSQQNESCDYLNIIKKEDRKYKKTHFNI